MKITDPKINKNLTETNLQLITNRLYYDLLIKDINIDFDIREAEFNGCHFINVDFTNKKLKDIDFIDCIFEKCNLEFLDFSNRSIHRCCFKNCNLTGCNLVNSSLIDISIINSKCSYINFSDSKIKHFLLRDSVVKEGRFVSLNLENIYFDNVDFSESEFLNTKLKGIDFSKCNITNIGTTTVDLKGIIINPEQALMLISLFGIIVKDFSD